MKIRVTMTYEKDGDDSDLKFLQDVLNDGDLSAVYEWAENSDMDVKFEVVE